MAQPRVSVIIPNRDSPLVGQTLASLERQDAAGCIHEILVVGTDRPGQVKARPPVRFCDTGRSVSAPVARNIGIGMASGDVLAFIDADCLAAADWLRWLLEARQAGHPIVGGGVQFPPRPYAQLCYNVTMFHDTLVSAPPGERPILGTLNLLVAGEVVAKVGLMDERLRRGQDTEWTLRMRRCGYRLYFEPRAAVTHLPPVKTVGQVLRLWRLSGQFNGWIRAQYNDIMAPPPFWGRPWLLRLSAPLIALAVTSRIFGRHPELWRYLHTAPVVYATKIAWCWGASQGQLPGATNGGE